MQGTWGHCAFQMSLLPDLPADTLGLVLILHHVGARRMADGVNIHRWEESNLVQRTLHLQHLEWVSPGSNLLTQTCQPAERQPVLRRAK